MARNHRFDLDADTFDTEFTPVTLRPVADIVGLGLSQLNTPDHGLFVI